MREAFKQNWYIVLACIIVWGAALLLSLAKEAAAATYAPTYNSGASNFDRDYYFQEFAAEMDALDGVSVQWSGGQPGNGTTTLTLCRGAFVSWDGCDIMQQAVVGPASSTPWTDYIFPQRASTTFGSRYYFIIQKVDWLKSQYPGDGSKPGGGWTAGGGDLYTSATLNFRVIYDEERILPDANLIDVEIHDNPYFERHHLEVPSPQWCANDNSQPCEINFGFNDRSWQSGIKLYNDVGGAPSGSYLASTTALEFYPLLYGNIELPHAATTSEGYQNYCLRLYNGRDPDELTCGVRVNFVAPSTITCGWSKTAYEQENDEGRICDGIATSSIWEAGSWPGAMECAGKKVGAWLFTASSSDYYDLCKATLAANERFPMNILGGFSRRLTAWAATTSATSSGASLPLFWAGATTSADLLPLSAIPAKVPAYQRLRSVLEIIIWGFALWIIIADLLNLRRAGKEELEI